MKPPLYEAFHRLCRRVAAVFQLARGRGLSADLFDVYYLVKKDPWNYRTCELEQRKYRDILSLLPQAPIESALELGCAEGEFTRMLAPRVGTLTALDSSPTALKRARRSQPGQTPVAFQEMNILHQDPAGQFDLVLASEILYYMGNLEKISEVASRMLTWVKPGGHLMLCHMRSQSDEQGGFPVPRWTPSHPGACSVHGIFDNLAELERISEVTDPLYRVTLYRLSPN